jgi:hypothetical protein
MLPMLPPVYRDRRFQRGKKRADIYVSHLVREMQATDSNESKTDLGIR